jgi:Tfp pilus assembly protein PilF
MLHFQRSQLLINQGRYDLAEKELRQVLSVEPDFASAHELLAVCLSEKKQYVEAFQEIGAAIALNPSHANFYYTHANLLRMQGNLKQAEGAILEALRLDTEEPNYHALLANIQQTQGRDIEALRSTEQGLSLDPEHVWSMNIRLLTLLNLGRISEAETEVDATLAISPNHPFPHAVKGWVLLHQNQISDAMHSFREALRIEPSLDWARVGLLEALKAKNDLYRLILKFDLWRLRLKATQDDIYSGQPQDPFLRLLFCPLMLLMNFGRSFFTLLLWFNPYGRLALTSQEVSDAAFMTLPHLFGFGLLLALATNQLFFMLMPLSILILASGISEFKIANGWRLNVFPGFVLLTGLSFGLMSVSVLFPEKLDIAKFLMFTALQGLMFSLPGLGLSWLGIGLFDFLQARVQVPPSEQPPLSSLPLAQKPSKASKD